MPGVAVVNQPAVTPRTAAGVEINFATETKLEAVRALLASLDAKDFSTEATLNAFLAAFNGEDFASQTTLAALLSAFNATDFSSETTLAALKASFDAEDFASQTTLAALLLAFNNEDFASQTTLAALLSAFNAEDFASQTTLALVKSVLDSIYLRQTDGTQRGRITDGTNDVTVLNDAGIYRLQISGKVQSVGAVPPPATTPVLISADTPLSVGTNDTDYVIPNGETFHLQQITAGNEDPTKGAVTLVVFDDGSEHVVERVYTAGFTVQAGFSDIVVARDGTPLLGNGTNKIVVRRVKYSGSNIDIDAEVRGYSV